MYAYSAQQHVAGCGCHLDVIERDGLTVPCGADHATSRVSLRTVSGCPLSFFGRRMRWRCLTDCRPHDRQCDRALEEVPTSIQPCTETHYSLVAQLEQLNIRIPLRSTGIAIRQVLTCCKRNPVGLCVPWETWHRSNIANACMRHRAVVLALTVYPSKIRDIVLVAINKFNFSSGSGSRRTCSRQSLRRSGCGFFSHRQSP
jgi:hypothetical protein